MAENNSIFRKKSLDRVSSPEQLNDYIRVANPGVWLVFLAVIVFLAGMIVWGAVGKLETVVKGTAVIAADGSMMYVSEDDAGSVKPGQTVRAGGAEFTVSGISSAPVELTDEFDNYIVHAGGFEVGQWVYKVDIEGDASEGGIYGGEIVTDSVSPLSFIMN